MCTPQGDTDLDTAIEDALTRLAKLIAEKARRVNEPLAYFVSAQPDGTVRTSVGVLHEGRINQQ